MGLFTNKKANTVKQAGMIQCGPFMSESGRILLPKYMLSGLSGRVADCIASGWFQEELKRFEPFREYRFKTYAQKKSTLPEGWEPEKGGLSVLDMDGRIVSVMRAKTVEKHGVKSAHEYNGIVIPPLKDPFTELAYNDRYYLAIAVTML